MCWQYPPAAFFLVAPLGALPVKLAYALWMAAGFGTLWASLRLAGLSHRVIALVLCSPLSVLVLNYGQTSFLAAAALIVAVTQADRRPVLAGIAAGLLTLKPQLGLLLPFLFVAAAQWRAFGAATVTTLGLAALATLAFGAEGWLAFFDSVFRLVDDFTATESATPARSMTTVQSQLLMWGVAAGPAFLAQALASVALAVPVLLAWRRGVDRLMVAALAIPAALVLAPYAYAYELVALALPVGLLIQRGGLSRVDGFVLVVVFALAATIKGHPLASLLQLPMVMALMVYGVVLVRCRRLAPGAGAGPRVAQQAAVALRQN